MNGDESSNGGVQVETKAGEAGRATVVLRGCLDVKNMGDCWRKLDTELKPLHPQILDVDVSQLDLHGSAGISLLRFLNEGGMTPGATVNLQGLSDRLRNILETFTAEDLRAYRELRPRKRRWASQVGAWVREFLQDLYEVVQFLGSVSVAVVTDLFHPKQMRWGEIKSIFETAGADALPVVTTFSFLVGLVLALEATRPLAQFGAQLYVAQMVGFAFVRDAGPLVAAIMLAGRSGSAFAAEIGTMKVNAELDALTTMGLNPVRFLVVQRMTAALLLTPLLSLYAMATGIVGGVMMLRTMGYPPMLLFHEILGQVRGHDLLVGMIKSLVFGLVIGGVGCLRGLQTGHGPASVGVSATRAVVAGILLVIGVNAAFSAGEYFAK